ncbi:MAG: hypothetical protein MJA83_13780 [Gammaproteobacteria bacterium]|nr:hypothetical protein [Gammaproteobacteria bacterium]
MKFLIEPSVFTAFPGMRVITVQANAIDNSADVTGVNQYWAEVWASAQALRQYGNAQSHPHIQPWRRRMLDLGVSGKRFPTSIEALLRRALKGGAPFTINPVVDFYNAVSLKYVVPAGAFDVADLKEDLILRYTRKGDTFYALDGDAPVDVPENEIAYTSGNAVITRHVVWRQARNALVKKTTRSCIFVSEILGELPHELLVVDVQTALERGMRKYFGVATTSALLSEQAPEVELLNTNR